MLFTLTSFSQKASKPIFDLVNAKKEIEQVNQKLSEYFANGDAEGISSVYSSDGYIMPDKKPIIQGKENIKKVWSAFLNSANKNDIKIAGMEATIKDLWGNENYLTDVGEFAFILKSGVKIWKGKYIIVWKKENGKWKAHREMTNFNEPDSVK
jgi:ketosteroid isomerase-like protein